MDSSDIDIAVISEKLYLHFWTLLRNTKGIYNQYYYKYLTASIFRGYINDKNLRKIDGIREEWDNLVAPINVTLQDKLRFEHPITYRIYRSWEDLEEYQLIPVYLRQELFWRAKRMFKFSDNRKTVNEIFTMFDEGKLIVDDTYQRRSV